MTNEEAIAVLNKELDEISLNSCTYDGIERSIALEMGIEAIKALKQEPKTDILDKISEEIEQKAYDWQEIDGEHESRMVVDLDDVIEIIDKYR